LLVVSRQDSHVYRLTSEPYAAPVDRV
jgi:hypothetical protein